MKLTHLEFPCKCRFEYDHSLPLVNGKPSIIFDPENIPFDCSGTWDLIGDGQTKCVFQLESGLGQTNAKKLKPENMEHLAALGAILRPGCMQSVDEENVSTTQRYIMRKLGVDPITYKIPALEPILNKTYGQIIYQENSILIARELAGFTEVEADTLRRGISKKKPEIIAKMRLLFISKAKDFGVITEDEAISIFDNIEKSQRYAFVKAHAVAYGILGYQTAYAKFHFTREFFTNYLYYAKEKQDPMLEIRTVVNDAKAFGFQVEPPRFSSLKKYFSTNGVDITFGLADIKGVGEKQVDKMRQNALLAEQTLGKPKACWSWYDFLFYFSDNCNSKAITNMLAVGALRDLKLDRRKMLFEYDLWNELSNGEKKTIIEVTRGAKIESLESVVGGLLSLPKGVTKRRRDKVVSIKKLLENPPSSLADSTDSIAKAEEENLGIAITCSKVDSAEKTEYNLTTCHQFKNGYGDTDIVLAVEITDYKEFRVKNGDNRGKKMCKLTVADATGAMDAVCFSKAYENCGGVLYAGNTVQLVGQRNDDGGFRVETAKQL